MTTDEISDRIFRIPGIEDGFIQEQHALDVTGFRAVSNADDATRITRTCRFRVHLHYFGKFSGDHEKNELHEAVKAAFAGLNLDVGERITHTQKLYDAHVANPPKKREREKDDELSERKLAWEKKRKDFILTLQWLPELRTWIES